MHVYIYIYIYRLTTNNKHKNTKKRKQYIYIYMCTHTYTSITHIYIYIYICACICICAHMQKTSSRQASQQPILCMASVCGSLCRAMLHFPHSVSQSLGLPGPHQGPWEVPLGSDQALPSQCLGSDYTECDTSPPGPREGSDHYQAGRFVSLGKGCRWAQQEEWAYR